MSIKLNNYKLGYRIVSLALNLVSRDKLLTEGLSLIYVGNDDVVLLPEEIELSTDATCMDKLRQFNDYDVLEIWENGVLSRRYNDKSDDNYFYITGACNSNCIMCPSPDSARKNALETNMCNLYELARHIPLDVPHLTITGGEPFLIGEKIYPFVNYLKEHFVDTEFLFLTNGRIFALDKHVQLFKESIPQNAIVAIPIHGSCDSIHDLITRVEGSFNQTMHGIRRLLSSDIRIEIRIVISRLNVDDFDNIADLIISQLKGIEYISIIAMEMTGNARKNKEQVWVSYRESFSSVSNALRKLVRNGFDVRMYNFPLCTVDKSFWMLCEKSISPHKVKFAEICEDCKYRSSCGGVFAGTYNLVKDELKVLS